ncbi:MAG: RNA polymerase sigma factor, partial [Parcubacteria group bacterium]
MVDSYKVQFIEFYREHSPDVLKYCYFRVSSKEEAEDLTSKVFLKTWDYITKGNKIDNLRAFIFKVAHNIVIDFYKTSKKDRELSIHNFEETT